MKIEVIFEDNHLLAVVKPQGVPVQKDSSGADDFQTALKDYLKDKFKKQGNVFLGIVHRLDQPVGGVMVFAKTSKAASRLSEQIRKNMWEKEYLAIVDGVPLKKQGFLEDYLIKDRDSNTVSVARPETTGAKKAVLRYQIIEKNEKRALLKISIETGRSHQIRVQLSSRGWPIVNDHRYNKNVKKVSDIALWAYSIKLIHPVKDEKITFTKDMPEKLVSLLD